MSNKFPPLLAALALLAASSSSLLAQEFLTQQPDASAPVPAQPLVRQSDPAAYTVAFVHAVPPAAGQADARDARLDVEKVEKTRHEVRRLGNGGMAETWYVGAEQFAMRNPFGMPMDRAMFYAAAIDGARSFPELAGVGPGAFVGTIRVGRQVVDVYRWQVESAAGVEPFLFRPGFVTAYVDDETRLPLALRTDDFTATYAFREPPAALTLPAAYQKAYQDYLSRTAHP